MAPLVDLDNQRFWKPPRPNRVLPPSQEGQHEIYSTAGQQTFPAQEELSYHHATGQELLSDVPICIDSELGFDEHGIGVLLSKDSDSQQVGPSQDLRSDDTLPYGDEIAASAPVAQYSTICLAELQELSSEHSSSRVHSRQTLPPEDSTPVAVHTETKIVHLPPTNRRSDESGSMTAMTPIPPPKTSTFRSATPGSSAARLTAPTSVPSPSELHSPVLAQPRVRRRASRSNDSASVDDFLCFPGSVPFDKWAPSSDARGDDSLPGSDIDENIDGSDSDICVVSGVTDDTDYSPSVPNNEKDIREGICDTHEMDEDDEPPVKRRRKRRWTSRSVPSTRLKRGGNASPPPASANVRTIDRNISTNAPCSPPPSHASIGDEDLGQNSATYQEWPGSLKLTILDGVLQFQMHFGGELDSTVLQALLHTQATPQKERHVSAGTGTVVGGSSGKRDTCSRNNYKQFTLAEDDRLIELKDLGYSWAKIHRLFTSDHPGRSVGSLQVRYCTKLKERARKKGSFRNPSNHGRVSSRKSVDSVETRTTSRRRLRLAS